MVRRKKISGPLRTKCLDRDGWRRVKCGLQPTVLRRYDEVQASLKYRILKVEYLKEYWDCKMATVVGKLICDHIIPVALGGDDDIDNLQTLCPKCDKIKTSNDLRIITNLSNRGKLPRT